MSVSSNPTLLVTGGSGHLGRRVLELLLQNTKSHIITTTRHPEKMADFAARGVEVRKADHDDPASLPAAYAGAQRMLIIASDSVGRRAEQVRHVVAAAEAAGVKHVCYTSSTSPEPSADHPIENDHFWSELAIMSSKLSWTILRHAMWQEHLYLFLPTAVATGLLLSTMGDAGMSYVTREDCAHTDVAALISDFTGCRILDVTGPSVVTPDDLAALASEFSGRPVKHVQGTPEEIIPRLVANGLPEGMAIGIVEFEQIARKGYFKVVASTVKDLTGRDPESVRSYISRTRADLLPDKEGRVRIDVHMARPVD
jgi:NAD(P)H dehydrogenase (quinone)